MMQNFKYQFLNISTVTLFSYILALTIAQFIRMSLIPIDESAVEKRITSIRRSRKRPVDDYQSILDSTFFKLADNTGEGSDGTGSAESLPGELKDLRLMGTITGPSSISRALIRKRTERKSEIFKLWNDVYGYKLVRISNSKVYLKKGDSTEALDMFAVDETKNNYSSNRRTAYNPPSSGSERSFSISKAEIQQKVLGNIDNALKGLRAGPHRVNNQIVGYKLFRVSPSNIAYKYGLRSGDIIKRVNGHSVNSTKKLLELWESVQSGESRVTIDVERRGRIETFNLNITD